MRTRRAVISIVGAGLVAGFAACSDSPTGVTSHPSQNLIISNPLPSPSGALVAHSGTMSARAETTNPDSVAFVSLPAGTAPDGVRATMRNRATGLSATTVLIDGGFDPVMLGAHVGDSIQVAVTDAQNHVVLQLVNIVSSRRPPVVVRTEPPQKKVDVPLNAAIVVVFSEPVDPATLGTGTVQLHNGATPVSGTVRLLPGTSDLAEFVPAVALEPATTYQLTVTDAVRDLSGDPLAAAASADFTTGNGVTGNVASVTVLPTSADLPPGGGIVLTALVRDSAGNLLTGRSIAWVSSDSSTVRLFVTDSTPTIARGIAAGTATVTATSEGHSGTATISVHTSRVAYVLLSDARVPLGWPVRLHVEVLDELQQHLVGVPVTWTSLTPAVATVNSSGEVTGQTLGRALIVAASGGKSDTANVTVATPGGIRLFPNFPVFQDSSLLAGEVIGVGAVVGDVDGNGFYPDPPMTWNSSDNAVALIVDSVPGLCCPKVVVRALAPGSATITATSAGLSASFAVAVDRVASVVVTPSATTAVPGGTATLIATVLGATGKVFPDRPVTFVSSDTTVASVPSGARVQGTSEWTSVTARALGSATVSATYLGVSGSASVRVQNVNFTSISTSAYHTCAIAVSGGTFCWGWDGSGELGTPTLATCNGGSNPCSLMPVAVASDVRFDSLSASYVSTCALTAASQGYCWGANGIGQLGIGDSTGPEQCGYQGPCSTVPVPIVGGLTFKAISGLCGLTTSGAAYCWGGSATWGYGPSPQPVSGGLTFAALSTPCGLRDSGADSGAYCWGAYGTVPVAVPGGLAFARISATNYAYTCALGGAGDAYCWGGSYGSSPVAVPGGLTFASISSGGTFACGVTATGAAYCWGSGPLGNSTTTSSDVPVEVAGGLTWASISGYYDHACGVTTSHVAYCWGSNFWGQLGTGNQSGSAVPVKVAGQP